MSRKKSKPIQNPVQRELDAIKRVVILLLIKAGAKQWEIAKALDIDQGDLSRMMPARQFKPFKADK